MPSFQDPGRFTWSGRRYARGDVIIVRFADVFVAGFEHLGDATRFLRDLRERFPKFSLELHPGKTRLIEFGRFAARDRPGTGGRGICAAKQIRLHASRTQGVNKDECSRMRSTLNFASNGLPARDLSPLVQA